jgi:hypothetical protein
MVARARRGLCGRRAAVALHNDASLTRINDVLFDERETLVRLPEEVVAKIITTSPSSFSTAFIMA